jgi:hypothetical protein
VGTAPQAYPLSNQANSLAVQSKFQLANTLEDGSNQIYNQDNISEKQGYYIKNSINFPALPTNSKLATTLEKGSANPIKNHAIISWHGNYLLNHLPNSISFSAVQFNLML